ncbi:MAG TPA: phosphatase PAP2 family protein, partial [Egibacteraceae bacterium]|nr:phosphatase PAP2 family protein [Egibacteraceae bacterium]
MRPGLGASLGLGLLAGSWYLLRYPAVQRADVRVGDVVRLAGWPPLQRAVRATTDLGSAYAVGGMAAALAAAGHWRAGADVAWAGAAAWNLSQLNKRRVRRERPYEAGGVRRLIGKPTGSSFPSGHAATGVAAFTVAAGHARAPRSGAMLRTFGAYVALSRVYVGVHYPTDVVGGAGLGLAIGSLWRGPLAAAGRALAAGGVAAGRRVGPPLLRAVVRVLVGVRLGDGLPGGAGAA